MEKTVIVGGGIAGLYLSSKIPNSLLLERQDNLGGRMQTKYSKDGQIEYEMGAWRIAKNHNRILRIIKDLQLSLCKLPSSFGFNKQTKVKCKSRKLTKKCNSSISEWGQVAINNNSPMTACKVEQSTGYDNFLSAAVGSDVYNSNPENSKKKTRYYVVKEGFSKLIEKLAGLTKGKIITGANVIDIEKNSNHYCVKVQRRLHGANKNSYQNMVIKTRSVILCVPPSIFKNYTISKQHLIPLTGIVHSLPLIHVYGKVKCSSSRYESIARKGYHIYTKELGSQIVSPMYSDAYPNIPISELYTMISYAGGRDAETLRNLALCSSDTFGDFCTKNVKSNFNSLHWPQPRSISDIHYHYWEVASHAWTALYGLKPKMAMLKTITPHMTKLPKVYIAGEAFSVTQGWIEGALETSEWVLKKMQESYKASPLPEKYIIYDDRVINLRGWMSRHPGTPFPLRNHMHQDVTKLMSTMNHPLYAYGILFHLQTGYFSN